jgi:cytochrome c oxidase cbb3-type subunit 3
MADSRRDLLLDHEYDGIQEYDNKLPNWWQYILYGTVVFAVGYWLVFQTFGVAPLPHARYDKEMAAAAEAQLKRMEGQEVTDQSLLLMSQVPERVKQGHEIFEQFCVVCHATGGVGNVGPNLTDDYWLHGARPTQILNTVTHGVPEKGMAAWGGQLGPIRIQQVVSYVLTLAGTHKPGKAPQGEHITVQEAMAAAGESETAQPAGASETPGASEMHEGSGK